MYTNKFHFLYNKSLTTELLLKGFACCCFDWAIELSIAEYYAF